MDDAAKRAKELGHDNSIWEAEIADAIREAVDAERQRHASDALSLLSAMTDEARLEVFGHFCTYCGRKDPTCQCWNDE